MRPQPKPGNKLFSNTYLSFKIVNDKLAENFDGFPYLTTLLSTSLWTFYGLLDPDDGILIITVNSVGVVFQIVDNILFIIHAPKQKRIKSLGLLGVLNIGVFGAVIVVTLFALHGSARRMFIGVLCATVTIGMYAAPLKVMGSVIRTKTVKVGAVLPLIFPISQWGSWFAFAMLLKDYYVLVPNAVGIVLGEAKLTIYVIYKMKSSSVESITEIEEKGPTHTNENGTKMQGIDIEHGGGNPVLKSKNGPKNTQFIS